MTGRFLTLAIIGAGGVSTTHIAALCKDPRARIVSIVDEDHERASARAKEAGASRIPIFKDAAAMFDEIRPQGIVICTPPNQHADIISLAAQRGAAILCEKPLAHQIPDAKRILRTLEHHPVPFLMGYCHRFVDGIRRMRMLIESGELGRPVMFRTHFSSRIEGIEATWFSNPDLSGGGVAIDTSILSVDLFRYLIGEVSQSTALQSRNHKDLRVEDTSIMVLQSRSGCLGSIESSWAPPVGAKEIEIRGTEGTALWDYDLLRWRRTDHESWTEERLGKPYQYRFDLQARHFLDVVSGRVHPLSTAEDGLRSLEIIHEVYRKSPPLREITGTGVVLR